MLSQMPLWLDAIPTPPPAPPLVPAPPDPSLRGGLIEPPLPPASPDLSLRRGPITPPLLCTLCDRSDLACRI